jgi:hypothetical protein
MTRAIEFNGFGELQPSGKGVEGTATRDAVASTDPGAKEKAFDDAPASVFRV